MQRTPMHVWLVRPGSHRFGQFLLPYSQTGKQSPSPRTRARPGFSSLRLSLSLSVSLAFSVCLSVSVPVSLCHRLSVSLSLLCFAQGMGWGAVLLSLCLSVSLSLCLSVSLSRSLSVSLLLSLSLSLCVFFSFIANAKNEGATLIPELQAGLLGTGRRPSLSTFVPIWFVHRTSFSFDPFSWGLLHVVVC